MKLARNILLTIAAAMLLLPAAAWAKPQVTLSISTEKDIVIEENGQQVTKRVPIEEVVPGEVVIYTLSFKNVGDETATEVSIVDPIPEGTIYIADSATQTGGLTFSIDGGQSYQVPSQLTYEVTAPDGTKQQRTASPEQYTHIRWIIPAIAAGEAGALSFQVKTQ
jgi:uncharacterized repeat protein (TIGR01451 family)